MPKRRTRPGRPRKQGDRYPSGNLRLSRDDGTPETQARRVALAQWKDSKGVWHLGDTTKTSTPLDALLTNRTITQEQHDAGTRFAWWYAVVYGRANGRRPRGGEVPDEVVEQVEPRMKAAQAALHGRSRSTLDVVTNICAYERFARWVPVQQRLPRHGKQIELLRAGLDLIGGAAVERRTA